MTDTLDRQVALTDIPQARDLIPTDRKLLPAPMEQLQEVGALIQSAGAFVSKEVRSDPGACVAIAYMAALHGTDPIMTASKAYLVNGRLAWEAQYISALVRQHIDEPLEITFHGEGSARFARVVGKIDGKELDYRSPQLGQIKTRNSPLWAIDPDQQLGAYYSVRAWARRHMPDVLLGIYAVEELQSVVIRDVTPAPNLFADEDAVLEEVEPEVDRETKPFEPSGGFTAQGASAATDEGKRIGQTDVADDPLEWCAACKTHAAAAESEAELNRLWEENEANRRALHRLDRTAHDDLERTFIDRQKELRS